MKVVFNCTAYKFHREYCDDIAEEISNRGNEVIFAEGDLNQGNYEADFCIQPDQIHKRLGARIGIWINHAMPVIPQNRFYYEDKFKNSLKRNSDYIFTFSEAWKQWHEMYGLPTYSVGMPKLDKYFNNIDGGNILYAPTHHLKPGVYSKEGINLDKLKKYGNIIFRGHPAFNPHQETSMESLRKAAIVISDYSSMGLEAIILNIPTILVGHKIWRSVRADHISAKAEEAAIRVYNQFWLEKAIEIYLDNPKHLEEERLKYSKLLCEYQGIASKKFVDTLEEILIMYPSHYNQPLEKF